MEQYISKSALVAEIKRRISEVEQIDKASYEVGLLDAYKIILSFINTLEVKEIDSTDASIEKALAYLNEKFYFNNLHYAVENNTFNCMEELFEDFEEYLRGE